MPEMTPLPRDPAPSRLAYRMQRLALTPGMRRAFVFGLPAASLSLIVALALSDQGRRDAMGLWWQDVKAEIQQREEFMVKLMAIDGASDSIAQDIREVVPLDFPMSSFDLDLAGIQAEVAGLDAVKKADIRIKPGGVLHIQIAERVPALVWRNSDGLELIDATGKRVSALEHRAKRADLPLVTGKAADRAAAEALDLLAAAAPLQKRIRGLVRVGERRWTLVLDRDQRILLPEVDPVSALEQVIAVDEAQELLGRDVVLVDMRRPARPTVRLVPDSAKILRQIKLDELGDD
ncbi:cell division protein FtsQ/DivIB [Maribius pontilimi]|uniref:Cell division protein FtsQ n=1 Tax=Palleronia pontilimi TaxID=1964209 RepID=A0A934IFM9_9RHOB|nr:cell division protein FtsQ/DivIB [Palleronia pontilimi]MBJ3762252.1 cell division protein FtsQ/DivIB [Palleronia pontilimi]